MQKLAKKQKRKLKAYVRAYTARFIALCIVAALFAGVFLIVRMVGKGKRVYEQPEMAVDLLPVNPYSRPGEALAEVNNVFVHYTANPGTSASQNRSYFANLAQTGETSASAHFIIGYEGEIVQCIPLEEIGYAVKGRNYDSISIECCYLEESGKFTDETYHSLLKLVSWLLGKYELDEDDVKRHYDEGGKNCPKYYVENEKEWKRLIGDLKQYIKENGTYNEPKEVE